MERRRDIGLWSATTKEEAKWAAEQWLVLARQVLGENDACVYYIYYFVQMVGCSLADIGTSEEELDSLIVRGSVEEARQLFRANIGQQSWHASNVMWGIRHILESSGWIERDQKGPEIAA